MCIISLSTLANITNQNVIAGDNGDIVEIRNYKFPLYNEAIEKTDVEKYSAEHEYETAVKDDNFDFQKITYLSDNLKVIAYLYKPKKLTDQKYPAIIFNRGSFVRGDIAPELISMFHRLASKGFVVLAPMYRQSDGGEGRDFLGGEDMNDLMSTLPLSKNLKFINTENLFMYGESRGGMMTYQAIRNGFPIKAAAVYGAFTDLGAMFKSQPDKYTPQLANVIWNDYDTKKEEIYRTRSAINWAEKFDVPVLIMHGGEDSEVRPKQSLKLAEKLSEMNKVYELVIFSEDNHILSANKFSKDEKVTCWFKKYMKKASF